MAGGSTTYTIVVTNNGPSSGDGAVFTDPAVANLTVTSVSCGSAGGGAACPSVPYTTIALMQGAGIVIPTLPPGGRVTFSVNATISSSAMDTSARTAKTGAADGGTISNVANIAAASGVTDTNPANNSAIDTDTLALVANLVLAKTDGRSTYAPGSTVTYSITVTNTGPPNATSVSVIDNLPSGMTLTAVPSCIAIGSATCGSITGIAGGASFTATGATVAAGPGNRLVYSVPVRFAAGLKTLQITNTATVSAADAPSIATASSTNTLGTASAVHSQPIPVDDGRALWLLICLILLLGGRRVRARQ